jgi:EAL domain-containing protein (putative c-di-GMP-specific phosphodiesterase class I)
VYRDLIELPAISPLELELELREAIALKQFVVHYQPVISVHSGHPVGAEALVRWAHPVRGMLQPSEFISFAESYDLIAPIGEFVLRAACEQLRRLDLHASDDFSIAVNVSARQFTKPGFVLTVASAIEACGLDARRLGIEITESAVMGDTAAVIATLAELKALGVKLSLDDFGTGYSSLAYIKNFPIHTLKIDRSFVTDMAESVTDQAIAKTIITLAHSLGMNVVAEGVETVEQFEALRAFGTDSIQGFLFSRPLSSAELGHYLARGNAVPIDRRRALTIRD